LQTMTPTTLGLLLVFLPMVSHGASGRDECGVDIVEQRLVSPTSVTIAWSYQCPEEKLKQFKFYARHLEYSACNDKTKKARLLVHIETNVSAREVTIDELHPFSRYTISVKASPKKEYRRMGMDDVESSEIEVITPHSRPTLRIKELVVLETEATKLSFSWANLPRDDPRILLKQNECERFESRPGQLHYKVVEQSEGVVVREGNLSLATSSLEVGSLTADTEYSLSIFVTDTEGEYEQGSTVSGRTVAASHDVTMVVVGIVVGLALILLLVALYAFLRRRGLPQRRKPRVETGVYSADRPILRTPRADVVRPYSDSGTSGRKSMEARPLPPRPGKPEPIYQEIPANGLKAPLAKEEEEEYDEAKYDDGEEKGFLPPRVPTPSSVTEEDEDGYLKPNFHRFQSTEKGDNDGVPAPIPMISYGSSQDPLRT